MAANMWTLSKKLNITAANISGFTVTHFIRAKVSSLESVYTIVR